MATMRTSSLAVCVLWLVVQSCSALKEDDGSGGLRNAVLQATEAIRKGMIEPVKYSEPNLKLEYQASTQFNPRGMANLYKVTNFFMDIIQKRDPYPEGFFSVSSDGRFQMADPRKEWHTLLMHYPGVVAVLAIGVLFAVLMPCVGFVFCCCRCSGRCGARSQPFEKRRDPCKRIGFGVLLSCITIIILYGVVCAFVTNEYMEEGTQKLPSKVRTSLNDTKLYMSNTQLEIKNLLEINFEELKQELDNVLQRSGEIVQQELFKASNATVLSNLTALVRGLSAIRKDLEEIDNNTKGLKEKSNILKERLRQVQNELLEQMKKCNSSCLDSLKDNIHNMTTNTDFNELPVIEDSLHTVSGLLTGGIEDKVEAGLRNFNRIKENIQKAVSDLLPSISANMDKVGNATAEQAKKINHILSNVSHAVTKHSSKYVDHGERALREYGHYRYYVGLGVSSILLVILLCATLGLFYGFCGKRPDGYGDDCCTRATGAWFLILGVWVIFLLSAVLMAVTLAHFLVGIVAKRAVCEPLQKPDNNQLLALLDEAVKANRILDILGDQKVDISLTSIIRSCHANGSIYEVLQVGKLVNISEVSNYKTRFKIEKDINALKNKINFNGSVTILSRDARIDLTRLLTSNITRIDFSSFTKILNKSIVSIDLMSLVEKLRTTASRIASITPDIRDSLEKQARVLESLQNNEVRYMERMVKNLENKTKSLELNLKFNHSSLNETIILLLDEVDTAQNYLNYNASREIRHLADEFADAILQHVDQYLNRVVTETRTRVGQCHPLSQVYNATIIATCNEILDPFNGFWASIGWCLVLFIPVIILSVKLAALYEKSDPYPGPLVESEYLYDAYGDRDNIPLANVDKKNYHRRYHESYENASGYYGGDYSTHLGRSGERSSSRGERPSPGAHSDTRYTDMAPKHWDYPNGGPPRYHSPPLSTEYERPPPYYYPGPGDNSRR